MFVTVPSLSYIFFVSIVLKEWGGQTGKIINQSIGVLAELYWESRLKGPIVHMRSHGTPIYMKNIINVQLVVLRLQYFGPFNVNTKNEFILRKTNFTFKKNF